MNNGWRLEVGGWRLEVGGSRLEVLKAERSFLVRGSKKVGIKSFFETVIHYP